MIVRAGNHELVGLDVLVEHQLPGIGAFDPQILRRLAAQDVADLGPDDVGEPIHGSLRIAIGRRSPLNIWRPGRCPPSRWSRPVSTAIVAYSAACLAPRTPSASAATKSATASMVVPVARPSASRLPRKASTSAVPTTAPSAFSAMPRAASGVRMPKPTHTGSLVCRLMRATASPTTEVSALALPVMPVMET